MIPFRPRQRREVETILRNQFDVGVSHLLIALRNKTALRAVIALARSAAFAQMVSLVSAGCGWPLALASADIIALYLRDIDTNSNSII